MVFNTKNYGDAQNTSLLRPARQVRAITPSDSTTYDPVIKGFRVTVAGDVSVTDVSGTTTVITSVQLGERIDALITRINATGTTATGIIAFID